MKRSELTGRHDAVDSIRGKSVNTKLMALAIGFAGLILAASAHGQGSLEEAWQVYEVTVSRGAFARTNIDPGLGLLIFSDGHYSLFVNSGDRPDVPPGSDTLATDELRLAALASFVANAGTYEVSGSKLTLHLTLARNPGGVGSSPELEYRIEGVPTHYDGNE
jgi:hypothetical protein